MIKLDHISKAYRTRNGWNQVLDDVSLEISKGKNLGILGLNGAGKSTLLRIIGGVEHPDSGKMMKTVKTSWPIGFTGGFQPLLTGRENTQFIARIYSTNPFEIEEYVNEFAELGDYFDEPINTYSSGMRSRLNFAVSFAIKFDCYLVDEATATGDRRFREKYKQAFAEIQDQSTVIIVSHQITTITEFCTSIAILHNGSIKFYEDINEGITNYEQLGRETRRITQKHH